MGLFHNKVGAGFRPQNNCGRPYRTVGYDQTFAMLAFSSRRIFSARKALFAETYKVAYRAFVKRILKPYSPPAYVPFVKELTGYMQKSSSISSEKIYSARSSSFLKTFCSSEPVLLQFTAVVCDLWQFKQFTAVQKESRCSSRKSTLNCQSAFRTEQLFLSEHFDRLLRLVFYDPEHPLILSVAVDRLCGLRIGSLDVPFLSEQFIQRSLRK